ncbi:NEQ203 [Nanoarchaeum equitans Kin4-M]|uniref:Proteasome subunit beta n=1 Tax=Nanoarchaeum equitans (strain Kin4-M) TaxID=228908 RepID=PSB_NANEQ|nr:RecName: Full=Proteasome subunit beta; AltName: Full=20S proteasome beta subunit; AltName: Full=Proteasome core protein PsmB; Flags: Precursor [Nanoarchaeum equitans Kin4-M]AAR39057.1 NEQ203 [Nanoarchaeum equitans Kin4-M]
MTTIIGIKARDGVVLASDKQASMGNIVEDKRAQKIIPITDYILLAGSGTVADLQHIAKILKTELKLRELYSRRTMNVIEAANLLSHLLYQNRFYLNPLGLLIAGPINSKEFGIYSLDGIGAISEIKDYFAEGSGGVIALGTLEAEYNPDITVRDAIKLAEKALKSSIARDVFSGYGIEIYTITKKGVEKLFLEAQK